MVGVVATGAGVVSAVNPSPTTTPTDDVLLLLLISSESVMPDAGEGRGLGGVVSKVGGISGMSKSPLLLLLLLLW